MIVRHARRAASLGWLRLALLAAALAGLGPAPAQEQAASPQEQFQELFARVQTERLFADSKTFADALPKEPPAQILREYRSQAYPTRAALAEFVAQHFTLPSPAAAAPPPSPLPALQQRIRALWPQLMRQPVLPPPWSSELPFGHRYVVPGGRFAEIYYWDSYFTMLGLVRDGYADVAGDMVEGFAGLIARYGHVPNGTRSYYLSRSQPPFFYLMVGLLAPQEPAAAYEKYLPQLQAEYAFWMHGAQALAPGAAFEHAVRLPDGAVLNRYWDRRDTPRDESYREDVELARRSGRPAAQVYRELRAAAESGWDFSSRWLADGRHLESIETSAIVPVDLNSLLYGLERAIAQGCARHRDRACAAQYAQRAAARRRAMNRYLWHAAQGRYLDYDWHRRRATGKLSAATVYPLFVGQADAAQAAAVAATVRAQLLAPGGLATTTAATGQQWDRPNGWAPLQWIAVCGLRAYGQDRLAREIGTRWLRTVQRTYAQEAKLVEKYDLQAQSHGGGGEYPLQDGFGWTNGVTRALLELYPQPAGP